MNAVTDTRNFADFNVADLDLAAWGRKEIAIAETEMPGLMAIREEFAPQQPLRGRISNPPPPLSRHPPSPRRFRRT